MQTKDIIEILRSFLWAHFYMAQNRPKFKPSLIQM
jgi:hypothetical protein